MPLDDKPDPIEPTPEAIAPTEGHEGADGGEQVPPGQKGPQSPVSDPILLRRNEQREAYREAALRREESGNVLTLDGTPRKRALPTVRCSAHSASTGLPCKNPPIQGGKVCEYHGGNTKLARAAAKRRFEEMVPRAQDALEELLSGEHAPSKLGAAKEVFDRSSLGPVRGSGAAGDAGVVVNLGIFGHPSLSQPVPTIDVTAPLEVIQPLTLPEGDSTDEG